jgi:hypothetical protein
VEQPTLPQVKRRAEKRVGDLQKRVEMETIAEIQILTDARMQVMVALLQAQHRLLSQPSIPTLRCACRC